MEKPCNYYDSYNHFYYEELNNISGFQNNIIHGQIIGELSGQPIKDAVIFGKTLLYVDDNGVGVCDENNHTFSDNNGNFQIIPYNYKATTQVSGTIIDMRISACGAEDIHRGWLNAPPVPPNETFTLKKINFDYSGIYNGIIVHPNENRILQAWESLTGSNLTFEAGSSGEIKARSNINILTESIFQNNSEVHIYTTPTYSNCPDFENFSTEFNLSR
ncbi:MAG: hypothetical protein WCI48_01820 [Bacteroidota bacterium]